MTSLTTESCVFNIPARLVVAIEQCLSVPPDIGFATIRLGFHDRFSFSHFGSFLSAPNNGDTVTFEPAYPAAVVWIWHFVVVCVINKTFLSPVVCVLFLFDTLHARVAAKFEVYSPRCVVAVNIFWSSETDA
ncbi:hypothetical protein T11_4205 [Trichinella zimbabwensis]|uniref:Uncharacterized protein n=1 Tax=Trichinella zimbabwensis TaxID=268475 RepID=A0A0V1HDX3_9BILA|nr:hypothetical protein T11_4205 [Trichinella zimbabwensis]